MTHRCFDAAYPPLEPPAGCDSVLGYIGGAKAYRVWTHAEWLRFRGLRQFPCWVPDVHGKSTPAAAGHAAVATANARGWRSRGGSRVIVCDLETTVAPAWYKAFAEAVNEGGYWCVAYGSASTVRGNDASNYWVADYDGEANIPGWAHAKQYSENVRYSSTQVDYSVISDWMYERGGRGPRHG